MNRRSLIDTSTTDTTNDSLDGWDQYARRNPRIGPAFQVKFNNNSSSNNNTNNSTSSNGTTSGEKRKAPIPMSSTTPYRTAEQVETGIVSQTTEEPKVADRLTNKPWSTMSCPVVVSHATVTKEWRSFLHPILQDQKIIMDTNKKNNNNSVASAETNNNQNAITLEQVKKGEFVQDLLRWYFQEDQQSRPRSSGRTKRHRPLPTKAAAAAIKAKDQLPTLVPTVWKSLDLGDFSQDDCISQYVAQKAGLSSNDITLDYLRLAWIVEWQHGQACVELKSRKRRRVDLPRSNAKTTASWVQEVRKPIQFWGDLRGECAESNKLDYSEYTGDDESFWQQAWKAVLAYAHALQKNMNDKHQVVTHTQMVTFVCGAANLVPPDMVFKGDQALMVEEIATCMWAFLDQMQCAREWQAKLFDLCFVKGVDVGDIKKMLQAINSCSDLKITIDECAQVQKQIDLVLDWQRKVDEAFSAAETNANNLNVLQKLAAESKTHLLTTLSSIELEKSLRKAEKISKTIDKWTEDSSNGDCRENVKFLAGIVRSVQKVCIRSPSINVFLDFYSQVENWIERANIAIRSRISLKEVEELIERGQKMPLDLGEFLEKLQSRASLAYGWFDSVEELIPCIRSIPRTSDHLAYVECLRTSLHDGCYAHIHELSCTGSRLPVEIDLVRSFQIELDAWNWTVKAKKWLPTSENESDDTNKKGKLEDLRDHLVKGAAIHRRVNCPDGEDDLYTLQGETEISGIVRIADEWHEQYVLYTENEMPVTYTELKAFVEKGQEMWVIIGSASGTINRVWEDVSLWYESNKTVLQLCGIIVQDIAPSTKVELPVITASVEQGKELDVVLYEVQRLEQVFNDALEWKNRADQFSTSRKQKRGKKSPGTVEDVQELIIKSESIPVDFSEEVFDLDKQVVDIQQWQLQVDKDLKLATVGFTIFCDSVNECYGPPRDYKHSSEERSSSKFVENIADLPISSDEVLQSDAMTNSTSKYEFQFEALSEDKTNVRMSELIEKVYTESTQFAASTEETEMAEELDSTWQWCINSLKYLDTQKEIFDKRYFGAFDRFVQEGKKLLQRFNESVQTAYLNELRSRWKKAVSDQLIRMNILLQERENFVNWSTKVESALAENKKISMHKMKKFAEESHSFPVCTELMTKVRESYEEACKWQEYVGSILNSSEKCSFQDLKDMHDMGTALDVACDEMRHLQSGIKNAKNWMNRVKRCKLDEGSIDTDAVKKLLKEHGELMVNIPEEHEKLQKSLKRYCICRRPSDGFMVTCDDCGDKFHGTCVGVSENRAGKIDSYTCVRCCLMKNYKSSVTNIVGIVKKWTNELDLKRWRQQEAQRHQRKVRKEKKDMKKLEEELSSVESQLREIESCSEPQTTTESTTDTVLKNDSTMDTAQEQGKTEDAAPPATLECASTHELSSSQVPLDVSEASLTTTPITPAINSETCVQVNVESDSLSQVVEGTTSSDQDIIMPNNNAQATSDAQHILSTTTDEHNLPVQTVADTITSTQAVVESNPSVQVIKSRLQEICDSMKQCEDRLSNLSIVAAKRKVAEEKENVDAQKLRTWCLGIRNVILSPFTSELAASCCPKEDEYESKPILDLISESKTLEIETHSDVIALSNHIMSVCWTLRCLDIFSRQPSVDEVRMVVDDSSRFHLSDEKGLKMMRTLLNRATVWQNKAEKFLTPIPGECKPCNVKALKDLSQSVDDIPLRVVTEQRVLNVIEDEGQRHCFCGGPSDGRFMLGCDHCDVWYHGTCLAISKDTTQYLETWKCPKCQGAVLEPSPERLASFHDTYDCSDNSASGDEDDSSSKAPTTKALWPPTGLNGSEKYTKIFGPSDEAQANGSKKDAIVGSVPNQVISSASTQSIQVPQPVLLSASVSSTNRPVVPQAVVEESSIANSSNTPRRKDTEDENMVGSTNQDATAPLSSVVTQSSVLEGEGNSVLGSTFVVPMGSAMCFDTFGFDWAAVTSRARTDAMAFGQGSSAESKSGNSTHLI